MEYISREDYCEAECGKDNREGYKACRNCSMLNISSTDVQHCGADMRQDGDINDT